jgi:hypothetical protein
LPVSAAVAASGFIIAGVGLGAAEGTGTGARPAKTWEGEGTGLIGLPMPGWRSAAEGSVGEIETVSTPALLKYGRRKSAGSTSTVSDSQTSHSAWLEPWVGSTPQRWTRTP